ncbi:MAG: hypothetical protein HFI08_02480 [Bacilli bacterium]|nr:hypothetical protein [Bacilli bacterium]
MKKINYFIICSFLFGVFLLSSSSFLLNETMKTYSFENTELAVTVDGVAKTTIPDKSSGKAVSSIVCDKGATGVWNYDHWTINIKNMTSTRTRCQINFVSKYNEPLLNGTDPVLSEGLIPVTIENNGVVKKASLGSKWYSYQEKQWANAIILNDASIVYADGETIPEDNIESYFVWIPKYRYQLWDLGEYENLSEIDNTKPHEIPIIFGDYDTKDILGECTTPMLSGESGNCKVGDYMTHPAFISMNTTGLWVGKFETGYKGSTSKESAEKNIKEPGSVQIKPNVNSWRSIQVANAFYTSYDYKREMDSHMMKNTEWGAVAYLSHSKYGIMSSIRINNHSNYVTGSSSIKEPTCKFSLDCNSYGTSEDILKPWNTSIGYLASTTGNISGIYDMSGGSWEYVMGVLLDQNSKPMSGYSSSNHSGFNGIFGCPGCGGTESSKELLTGASFPDAKYYDSYRYFEEQQNFKRRILGDATGEMGPFSSNVDSPMTVYKNSWYEDVSWFVTNMTPWFYRGYDYVSGKYSGIFAFGSAYGHPLSDYGFRIVLSIS